MCLTFRQKTFRNLFLQLCEIQSNVYTFSTSFKFYFQGISREIFILTLFVFAFSLCQNQMTVYWCQVQQTAEFGYTILRFLNQYSHVNVTSNVSNASLLCPVHPFCSGARAKMVSFWNTTFVCHMLAEAMTTVCS